MRGFFNGLVLGIILGAVGFWFVQKKAAEHPEAQQRYEDAAVQFRTNASAAAENTSDALSAKLDTLDLHADQIKDELAKTGEVIRRKAQDIGEATVNAASDARAVKEFADTETILDRLDTNTAGGIKEVLDAIQALHTP